MSAHVVLPASASREEWLAVRRFGLGGSDVAAAIGLSPYTTPFQLWLEKTGRVVPEPDAEALQRMRWGQLIEPLLLQRFDERHPELVLVGGEGIYADDDHEWRMATVDGLGLTPGRELAAIVEAKTANHRQVPRWADAVPLAYEIQVQWYMSILDAEVAHLIALLDTNTEVERVVERDERLIADLHELANDFWCCVVNDDAPDADAHPNTARLLARQRPCPGTVIDLDPAWEKAIARRAELSDQISVLTTEKTRIDNELRTSMGDAEEAQIDGRKVATFRAPSEPTRSCRWHALRAASPEAYAEHVTERPAGRRLTYTSTEEET